MFMALYLVGFNVLQELSIICDVKTTNEATDKYLDKLFEFEEKPKYRTI